MTAIQEHMLKMFIALRWGVGIIGLSLPVILGGVGYLVYGIPLAGSMSAYYHASKEYPSKYCCADPQAQQQNAPVSPGCQSAPTSCPPIGTGPMRNWFVGNMFFIGAAMFLLRGFSWVESWALNIAGIMAPCVGLFPMNWGSQTGFNPHQTFAVTFFVCVAITCIFCADKTLQQIPMSLPHREKVIKAYKRVYIVLGVLMVGLPVLADFILHNSPVQTFFVEAGGVWAFGLYWLVKTFELEQSDIERRAMKGELPHFNPHTLI